MNIAVAKQLDYYTIEDIYNLPDGQILVLLWYELLVVFYYLSMPINIEMSLQLLTDASPCFYFRL